MTILSIGTAQFGLDYGITNKKGIIEIKEVRSILREARLAGINSIDTAHAYGNAHVRLGMMSADINDLKITTKVGVGIDEKGMSTKQIREHLAKQLEVSLCDLRTNKIDTILLHTSKCLTKSHRNGVLDFLHNIKEQGIAGRVGVSVYRQSELDEGYVPTLDVVQLPLSLYNQRMLHDGSIQYLNRLGISIQVRGVFHQGLLLCSAEVWPQWINEYWKQRQRSIEAYVEQKEASLIEAALGFIQSVSGIETVVVGVCSKQELQSIVEAWNKPIDLPESLRAFPAGTQDGFCDPRKWPVGRRD